MYNLFSNHQQIYKRFLTFCKYVLCHTSPLPKDFKQDGIETNLEVTHYSNYINPSYHEQWFLYLYRILPRTWLWCSQQLFTLFRWLKYLVQTFIMASFIIQFVSMLIALHIDGPKLNLNQGWTPHSGLYNFATKLWSKWERAKSALCWLNLLYLYLYLCLYPCYVLVSVSVSFYVRAYLRLLPELH